MSTRRAVETVDTLVKYVKSATMDEAEAELIGMYGERYLEYRRQWQLAGEMNYEPEFPLYMMLEQTYRCNMRCVSCIHGYPALRKKFSLNTSCMPWQLFERIVLEGEQNSCPSISMHNNDEPLLVKDLEKRIAFAREHGFMDVIMTTNGIAFTEERIKGVIDAGVTRILFSVDALTEETYNKVRPRGDFSKVLWAMGVAREYRASRKSHLPILRASFVANRLNQHEMETFLARFSPVVDYIDVQPFCTYYDANVDFIPEGARHVSESEFRCNSAWKTLIIRGNGQVLPCPNFYGTELVMGNVYQNSIKEIFNSPSMRQLRREFKEGTYRHTACQECSKGTYEVDLDGSKVR